MNPSTALATVLVDELVANGVVEVVLCPGSRNAPLSMALHAADAAGRLRLHVRIDERTAGFLALGLARGSGRPAAVATTSGTAVANLHPAVLEAHHGGVGLIVLSADRPPWLRGVGANQTIDQRDVFGISLRLFHEFGVPERRPAQQAGWRSMVCRAVAAASGADGAAPGPVQLNLPLTEPLLPAARPEAVSGGEIVGWPEYLAGRAGPWTQIGAVGPGAEQGAGPAVPPPAPDERVVFLADLTHPWAAPIARAGHLVVAEAGGAAGGQVLDAGMLLLGVRSFLESARPDRVIVLGRPTLFRSARDLLADTEITVDVVARPAGYADVAGTARAVAPGLPDLAALPPPGWAGRWRDANALAGTAIRKLLRDLDIGHSPRLAADLVAALPDGGTLVLGSSQPPRDVGLASAARDGLRIVANRGVAGIDGTVSTAAGVALARARDAGAGPTIALLGDLTFLHDLTGLVIGPHEPRPDLTIVVSNNDGGGIFGTLEPGRPEHAHAFERVFGTPHGVALAGLVEATGAEHVLVTTAEELRAELVSPAIGIRVLEVPTSRTDLAATLQAMRDVVAAEVARG